jgi:adenylate cyclase
MTPPESALEQLATLSAELGRCQDLDHIVSHALSGIARLFGYEHSLLLLRDEDGSRLYTIATHGYDAEGIGSEVQVGEGVIGMAAGRAEPMRVGNLGRMLAYARTVRRAYEEHGVEAPGREIPLPGLADAESQVAVPAMVLGQLVGVLAIESREALAFGPDDEALLQIVANLIASAIEIDWAYERAAEAPRTPLQLPEREAPATPQVPPARVRFFAVDGSTFLDGDYLIKGVAGRILWVLLSQYVNERRVEFTNKEVRLDPSLELPEFRDNFESRLILLKRRLDEHGAPVRIEKSGRGRFRVLVDRPVALECVAREPD